MVAAGVELAQVLRQTRGALIGAVVVAAVQVTMVDQVVVAVVRVVRGQVVQVVAVVELPRPGAREAVEVRQVVAAVLLVAQTPALEAPAALRATTSSAIRL